MLDMYCNGEVEIGGQCYPAEVNFEWDESGPVIHSVLALREVAKKNEVWYDRDGQPHWGPKWIKLDVTDWVNLSAWREEIIAHQEYIEELRPSYRKAA